MSYTKPVQEYKRSPTPTLQGSQQKWLEEEMRKLERVLESVTQALKEIDSRLTALE